MMRINLCIAQDPEFLLMVLTEINEVNMNSRVESTLEILLMLLEI